MNIQQEYYLNGFVQKEFNKDETLERLLTIVREIHSGKLKEGFSLEEKYKHSKDLRPSVVAYDDVFIDILAKNNIAALLKEATGYDLFLHHFQLRISFPGESYMDWHRDTHIYDKKIIGNIPPVHKLIFYPTVGGVSYPRLLTIKGSHRRQTDSNLLDHVQRRIMPKETIASSDSQFLVFDTSLLHAVVPEQLPQGSFRLIYSFCHEFELAANPEYQKMADLYRAKVMKRV